MWGTDLHQGEEDQRDWEEGGTTAHARRKSKDRLEVSFFVEMQLMFCQTGLLFIHIRS